MGVGSGSSVGTAVGGEVAVGIWVGVSDGAGVAVGGTGVWGGETTVGVGGSGVNVWISVRGCDDAPGRVQIKARKMINSMMTTISLKRS